MSTTLTIVNDRLRVSTNQNDMYIPLTSRFKIDKQLNTVLFYDDTNYIERDVATVTVNITDITSISPNYVGEAYTYSLVKAWLEDVYTLYGTNYSGTYEPANPNIQIHIADPDVHVTLEDKSNWDAKQEALLFVDPTENKFLRDDNTFQTVGDGVYVPLTPSGDVQITFPSNKTLSFSQPTWRDEYPSILVPATGAAAPDDAPHTVGGVLRNFKAFDGNSTEERLGGSFEIPHDYMIGQSIEVHVHWRPSASSTGTVTWYFDWEYSPPNAAAIAQTTLSVTNNIATDKQYFHLLDTFGLLPQPSTPFGIGGKIGFNIRRTPNIDTYGADSLLEQISLHVPCDTAGSRQIYTK